MNGMRKIGLLFALSAILVMGSGTVAFAGLSGDVIFVTNDSEIVIVLPTHKDGEAAQMVIRERFEGSIGSQPSGLVESISRINSFIGDDPGKWSRDIKSYNKVSLGTLYDGIVLELKATGQTVEKIFTVQPGADPDHEPGYSEFRGFKQR
jgi:hypothetical protein